MDIVGLLDVHGQERTSEDEDRKIRALMQGCEELLRPQALRILGNPANACYLI